MLSYNNIYYNTVTKCTKINEKKNNNNKWKIKIKPKLK